MHRKYEATMIMALSLVFAYVLLARPCSIAQEATIQTDRTQKTSALHGRLWDGVASLPISAGHVFVLDSEYKKVLGYSTTQIGRGPDSGGWQITNLPKSGDVWLVGFHPEVKMNMAIMKVSLNGQYQEVKGFRTNMGIPQIVSDASLSALLGTIAHEASRIISDKSALAFAESLLELVEEEENDSFSAASGVSAGNYGNLYSYDDDWYKILVESDRKLEVDCTYFPIYLYDSSEQLIATSTDNGANWSLNYDVSSAGYYYIYVPYYDEYEGQNGYSLNIGSVPILERSVQKELIYKSWLYGENGDPLVDVSVWTNYEGDFHVAVSWGDGAEYEETWPNSDEIFILHRYTKLGVYKVRVVVTDRRTNISETVEGKINVGRYGRVYLKTSD